MVSERAQKLVDDLKESIAIAIDGALDDAGITTGYSLCEDTLGNIQWDKYITDKGESDLHLRCYSPYMKPIAQIVVTPKKKFS